VSPQNKDLVLAYVDAFNRGDVEAVARLFGPDALVYGVLGWGTLEQVAPIWREIIDAFEVTLHVEAIVAEEDVVAVRYIERGRSARSFRGGPVTRRSYEVVAMEWFEVRDGRIRRRRGARDSASQFRQMGLPLA
jgi:steroid delta-isomerase-like uncharacterized protein